jgi:hypothetical protein
VAWSSFQPDNGSSRETGGHGSADEIDCNIPPDLDVHLVLDNSATRKTKLIRDWLAKRPRYHVHFTPTSSLMGCR